ncbi:MAG: hypothetical protein QG571_1294 [Pseudomonadota bacterium]|nr:hypothetical protein [Pseudomonadota bacterium]
MIYVHLGIAAWFALARFAYRHEREELLEDYRAEKNWAAFHKNQAVVAIEGERLRRFDYVPPSTKGTS